VAKRAADRAAPRWRSRLLWLVGLWAGGVAVTVVAVELVRLAMAAAGMRTH
jgi:hypothetical protein